MINLGIQSSGWWFTSGPKILKTRKNTQSISSKFRWNQSYLSKILQKNQNINNWNLTIWTLNLILNFKLLKMLQNNNKYCKKYHN